MNPKSQDALAELTPQQKRDLLRRMLQNRGRQQREFALSQHQRGMWFLSRIGPEIASYNTALAVQASPRLDAAALSGALQKLVQRHAALRTIFIARDGVPSQRVCENASAPVRIVDVTGDDEGLQRAVIEDYRLPFDLESSPMRVTLFRREDSDVLMLNVHHIAFDAWSANILYRELQALYDSEFRGRAADLPPISATYHDFVAWQSKMLESEEGEAHWRYWSGRLSGGLAVLELPLRKKCPSGPSSDGGTIRLHVAGATYEQVKQLVREQRTTMFSVVAAAYSVLLHRLSGQHELIIGTAVSGRTQPQWAGVVGDFINMLPLRFTFPDELCTCDHVQAVSTEIRNALAHQDFPFPLMVERMCLRREAGRSPIFQAMINVHVARPGSELSRLFDDQAMPFGGSLLRNYPLPQQEGQFDLGLELLDTGEALVGGLRYSEAAFDAEAATYMAGQLVSVLEQIAAQPHSRVSEYRIDPFVEPGRQHFVI